MKLTLKNILINKELFIKKCKKLGACEKEFRRLLKAQSEDDFIQVVLDNYSWVNRKITEEYDFAHDFSEGLAIVNLDDKYGFMDNKGEIIIPIIYDYAFSFYYGLAKVKLNDEYFRINKNNERIKI